MGRLVPHRPDGSRSRYSVGGAQLFVENSKSSADVEGSLSAAEFLGSQAPRAPTTSTSSETEVRSLSAFSHAARGAYLLTFSSLAAWSALTDHSNGIVMSMITAERSPMQTMSGRRSNGEPDTVCSTKRSPAEGGWPSLFFRGFYCVGLA